MQLFKSLLCWQGFDNRQRFLSIHGVSYLTIVSLASLFPQALLLPLLALLFATITCITSTKRRLNDSEITANWQFIASALFFIFSLLAIVFNDSVFIWLLLLPALASSLLLTYREKQNKVYILGYNGPIDLSEYSKAATVQRSSRIEPVLAQSSAHGDVHVDAQHNIDTSAQYQQSVPVSAPTTPSGSSNSAVDFGENIRALLIKYKKAVIVVFISVTVLILTLLSVLALQSSDEMTNEQSISEPTKKQPMVRLSKITLPDNFSVMLSSYDGIIIGWQADETNERELWSQESALGDKSCSAIEFNNGDKIRTLAVNVEQNSDYFASFSPLDSQKIVKSLALRGKFSLCSYSFSLKGSQAVLGKHIKYGEYLSN